MRIRHTEPDKPPLTPLIDIAFLVLIFFMALPLKRLDHRLDANLPTGRGINEVPETEPPPTEITIRVLDQEFRLGQHVLGDARELRPLLTVLGPESHYLIDGNESADWERMIAVVDVFAGLRYRHVTFRGTAKPSERIRRSLRLPRPADK